MAFDNRGNLGNLGGLWNFDRLARIGEQAVSKTRAFADAAMDGVTRLVDVAAQAIDDSDAKAHSAETPASLQQLDETKLNAMLATLDERYFQEDFDPVLNMLQKMPAMIPEDVCAGLSKKVFQNVYFFQFVPAKMSEVEDTVSMLDYKLHQAIQSNSASFGVVFRFLPQR